MRLKQILVVVAAAAALAACQPPAAPTADEATTSEAATTEPATTAEPAPAALPCGILAQRNWTAALAAGANPTLTIAGEIDLPKPGFSVSLARDPADAADTTEPHLILSARPPTGMTTEVVTPTAVHYFGRATGQYATVHVMCDGASVTDISVTH